MTDPSSALGALLRGADPDRVADVADAYVRQHHSGCRIEVLLADYRVSGLWPVIDENHSMSGLLSNQTASAVRAFASQTVVVEPASATAPASALIPLTVWGERVGVLAVDFPDNPGATQITEFVTLAEEVAMALLAADRATDRYRRTRRRQRLTMAAEMQWELLPGRALVGPNFHLAGQLEPAYQVCGDHFDWSLNGQRLTLTALNGDGNGIPATLLTVVAINAMRNARRSGANLIEQAELASDAIFSLHGGKHHVATLLLEVDLATGTVLLIDAGSPVMLRMRGTQVSQVVVDHQLPLGMFADTRYVPQQLTLDPGDRLFIVSDGVHAAQRDDMPAFGEKELIKAARATRLQPATEAVGGMMRGLHEYHDGHHLADDAVIVCLDWQGKLEDHAEY